MTFQYTGMTLGTPTVVDEWTWCRAQFSSAVLNSVPNVMLHYDGTVIYVCLINTKTHHVMFIHYFAPVRGAKYCDEYVCVFVCLSVSPGEYLRNHMRNFYQISVHVAYGRGSVLLRVVAIRYVLPVLCMTSCFL